MTRYIPRRLAAVLGFVFVFLASFAGVAMAQAAAAGDSPPGLYELVEPVITAVFTGQPGLAAALALVLVAGVVNRYAGKRWAIFNASWARALTVLVGSFGGAAAVAIGGGAAWSLGLAWKALGVAAGAAGIFGLVKSLLLPLVKSLHNKLPGWLRPPFDLVLAIFEKPDPIAEAVAAGDAAVAANPSTGISGVVGAPVTVDEPSGPTLLPRAETSAADAMATELK